MLLSLRRKGVNLQKFITQNHHPSLRGSLPALLALLQAPALQTLILQTPLMVKTSVLFVCLLGGWCNLNGTGPKFTSGHSTVMVYMIVCLLGGSIAMCTLLVEREQEEALDRQVRPLDSRHVSSRGREVGRQATRFHLHSVISSLNVFLILHLQLGVLSVFLIFILFH